jgi:alternate signal-mediated exported protein
VTRRRKLGAMAVAALLLAAAGAGTFAAFVATTQNDGDQIESGSVKLEDNDSDSALLTLNSAQPGATDSGCIEVKYGGTLDSGLRLYGTTSGSGLDQYLTLKVTRGVHSPSNPGFDSCTNFQADGTDYIGAGIGVIYDGTLQGFADSYATGLIDASTASPETWTTGEIHVYKLEVTLQGNPSAQGKDAAQTFTWEVRNQ